MIVPKKGIIKGVRIIPRPTHKEVARVMRVKVEDKKSLILSFDSVSRYRLKVGIKATEMLFSAKRRRKRFGIIKARENASERADVPKKAAFVISRTRPKTRETRVKKESREPFFINELLIFLEYHTAKHC